MTAEFIFDRQKERQALCEIVQQRRPALIHGPAGVGKSLLIKTVIAEFPNVLYCGDSSTGVKVLRTLAGTLMRMRAIAARSVTESLEGKSAVSLKGIVADALREGRFCVILDHVNCPGTSFGGIVRELIGWASTPVIAVARSAHMEDAGSLRSLFPDRRDQLALRNFDRDAAERFAREALNRSGLVADNTEEFLSRVLDFSKGNPGAILTMLDMAKMPTYRTADQIKITPLYIDYRLSCP